MMFAPETTTPKCTRPVAGSARGRVTVVIPTFNRAALVQRAVQTALNQTAVGNCDIVVVDDGSTDDTARVLRPHLGQIRYIYRSNGGVSVARNTAILAQPNEFVAFLDSDDEWEPQVVERQLDALRRHPEVVLVAGRTSCRAGGAMTWPAPPPVPFDRPVDLAPHLFERCVVQTPAVMVRGAALERVGLFHADLRNCGDHELWTRLACLGPCLLLSERLAVFSREPLERLTGDADRAFVADLRARYRMRPLLRWRPDCTRNWRRGLARTLQILRDHAYRDRRYFAAARYGLRSLGAWPQGRARWEWGRVLHALLRAPLEQVASGAKTATGRPPVGQPAALCARSTNDASVSRNAERKSKTTVAPVCCVSLEGSPQL